MDSESKCKEVREIIEEVNKRTVNRPLTFAPLRNFGGSSDHVSFLRKGIPAFFFFSGEHGDLHRPTDDPDKIEYDKMQKIARLVYELTIEFANRDAKLCGR